VEIKGREQLVRLMVKAERAMGWITAKVGEGWIPLIFANTSQDLENFLKEYRKVEEEERS